MKKSHKAKGIITEVEYDSSWERLFAGVLEVKRKSGEILDYGYAEIRLKLGDGSWYKPDFWILPKSLELTMIEVKGFWREAGKVRFKVARSKFHWLRFEAWTKDKSGWIEQHF